MTLLRPANQKTVPESEDLEGARGVFVGIDLAQELEAQVIQVKLNFSGNTLAKFPIQASAGFLTS